MAAAYLVVALPQHHDHARGGTAGDDADEGTVAADIGRALLRCHQARTCVRYFLLLDVDRRVCNRRAPANAQPRVGVAEVLTQARYLEAQTVAELERARP